MISRAWTVTRNLDIFRLLGLAPTMLWLSVVMQIHFNGDDGDLLFSPRCRSLDHLARGAGGCEADLKELIACDLLIWLEEGGVALPDDLGLRLPERVGGKTTGGLRATPPQRQGKAPDGNQREMLYAVPSNSESPKAESPPPLTQPGVTQGVTQNVTQTAGATQVSALAGGEGTTTTTKDSESFLGGGGGESVTAREPTKAESPSCESPNSESPPAESPPAESPPLHVTLAAELLPLVGRAGFAAPAELNAVRSWLETKTANEIREAIGTRMEQTNARLAPDLRYFDKRVREWTSRVPFQPPLAPTAPAVPEPPEDPAETVALIHPHDPDNARLVARWPAFRAMLKAEVPEAEYQSWLRGMKLGGLDGDEIVLILRSGFVGDWVAGHYGPRVNTWWKGEYPEAHRVVCRTG